MPLESTHWLPLVSQSRWAAQCLTRTDTRAPTGARPTILTMAVPCSNISRRMSGTKVGRLEVCGRLVVDAALLYTNPPGDLEGLVFQQVAVVPYQPCPFPRQAMSRPFCIAKGHAYSK